VLHTIFDGSSNPKVLAAAAHALGRLGGDAELDALIQASQPSDGRRIAAIEGLGECKRIESAKHLASLLASADEASAEAIAGALGTVGSSWAWKAMGPSAAATGLKVRELAARALLPAFVRYRGDLRATMRKGLLMVEHPVTVDLISKARSGADADTASALDQLKTRLEKQSR
jgi:HEAT repeat protein